MRQLNATIHLVVSDVRQVAPKSLRLNESLGNNRHPTAPRIGAEEAAARIHQLYEVALLRSLHTGAYRAIGAHRAYLTV